MNDQCTDEINSYNCTCIAGFEGEHCDIGPCESNPCLNNGTCRHGEGYYECDCAEQYAGLHCQQLMPEVGAWVYVTVSVVAIGLLVAFIVVAVVLGSRRFCRQSRPTPAPEPGYTALSLAPMSNNDAVTGENEITTQHCRV